MAKYLDKTGLTYLWSKTKAKLDEKADKTTADNLQNQIIYSKRYLLTDNIAKEDYDKNTFVAINGGELRRIKTTVKKGDEINSTNSMYVNMVQLAMMLWGNMQMLQVGSVTVDSGTNGVEITASMPYDSHKFVCWLGVSSVGFIGSPYLADMSSSTTNIFDKNTVSGHTYKAFYLKYIDQLLVGI